MLQPSARIACPDVDTLVAYHGGRLTEVELESLAAHIDACPNCSSVLDEIESRESPDHFVAEVREHLLAKDRERTEVGFEQFRQAIGDVSLDPLSATTLAPSRDDVESELPESVGPYEILAQLGVGGMGVVYKAVQHPVNRLVALKMIRGGPHASDAAIARFRTEGEAVARLKHAGVVQIYEYGTHEHLPYFSMELVDGGTLKSRLHSGPLPVREAADLIRRVAQALAYAHGQNVLHRDLKPGNILLTPDGEPKISDFGLAKLLDSDDEQTLSEALIGTPSYMSPEQATAGKVRDLSPAVDIWAIGVILYESLTGVSPFRGADRMGSIDKVLNFDPPPPSSYRKEVPRDLDAICLKCVEKTPDRRYRASSMLADDLQRLLAGEPTHARPPSWFRLGTRYLRRHVAALSVSLIFCMTVGTVLATRYFSDPNRALQDIESQMGKGEPVELISESGEPRWSHWLNGEKTGKTSISRDGYMMVHSWGFSLISLTRHVPYDAYTLSAEVFHEKSDIGGRVGLFCMYSRFDSGPEVIHQFVSFHMDDIRASQKIQNNQLPPQGGPDGKFNQSQMVLETFTEFRPPSFGRAWNLAAGPKYKPTGNSAPEKVWRRLGIAVGMDNVRCRWEEDDLPACDWQTITERSEETLRPIREGAELHPKAGPPARNGAVGLWVSHGSAGFRNVRLRPTAKS